MNLSTSYNFAGLNTSALAGSTLHKTLGTGVGLPSKKVGLAKDENFGGSLTQGYLGGHLAINRNLNFVATSGQKEEGGTESVLGELIEEEAECKKELQELDIEGIEMKGDAAGGFVDLTNKKSKPRAIPRVSVPQTPPENLENPKTKF